MARYGQKFKWRVAARLLPPESSPVEVDSQTVAISVRRNRTLSEVAGTTYAMIDIHQLRQLQLGPPRLH
jgi:hypothetical protein